MEIALSVGNQLPILLISFPCPHYGNADGWESVTNPLDKLFVVGLFNNIPLGISYQSS